jgi:hypothetical protein
LLSYTRSWPGALFPDSNLAERLPTLLAERPYKSLIVLTPSNNIKNLENYDRPRQNELAVKTALDTVSIVQKALVQSSSLEKAVLVELPPRTDSGRLSELTEFSNSALREAVRKSTCRRKITIASLDMLYQHSNLDIFGSHSSPRYDGIHLRGKLGPVVFTNCLLTAVASAGLTSNFSSNRYTPVKLAS